MKNVIHNMVHAASWVLALVAMTCGVEAKEIYFSDVGTVGGGAAVGNPVVTHNLGDASGTLYIWVTNDQRVNQSLSLNILSSTPGVVAITDATMYNPFVDIGGGLSQFRWQGTGDGTTTPDSIQNLVGVRITEGFGLNPIPLVTAADPNHDAAAASWLVAEVQYDVIGLGSTTLSLSPGPVDIVDDGVSVAGQFGFGTGLIEVVPEPTTIGLLLLSMTPLARRRG